MAKGFKYVRQRDPNEVQDNLSLGDMAQVEYLRGSYNVSGCVEGDKTVIRAWRKDLQACPPDNELTLSYYG